MATVGFSADVLKLDYEKEAERICESIRASLLKLKRRGAVVGLSGGIDSSAVSALCVRALGKNRVFGLLMPEGESSDDTLDISKGLAIHLGIEFAHEDISEPLKANRAYERRDDAIRKVIPEYGKGWKSKIVLPTVHDNDSYRIYSVVAQSPSGEMMKVRLTPEAYLGIVAATNFKQRNRKMLEYYYGDRFNYAVAGTPNRLEYDQGFFVKGGDGLADFKPIAHLYKTQVYAMARHLGVPSNITNRAPTTDTYSLPQGQDEFYFSLPYDKMDVVLYGKNHGVPPVEIGKALGLTAEQVERVFRDIDTKRATTHYLHARPMLVDKVTEIAD